MSRSRRKLSMWGALPPYLGGKRRLCPIIFREIDRVLPRRLWAGRTFLDAFLGGGSVSLYAKAQGFRVVATDIAERSIIVGRALIENSRVRLTREDVLRVLAPREDGPGPIEREMVPAIFTRAQARAMDRAMAIADRTGDSAKAALLRLLAVRIALLAHPFSYVRKGTIHRLTTGEYESMTPTSLPQYVSGLRLATVGRLWEIAEELNAAIFEGWGEVHQADILEALPGLQADITYFDPPYAGTLGYERTYRLLDRILGETRCAPSRFSDRDGASQLDRLFERAAHIPIWVLSFGQETVAIDDLVERMKRFGREARSLEVKYQRMAALAKEEKRRADREYLVVGWDPEALTQRGIPLRQDGPANGTVAVTAVVDCRKLVEPSAMSAPEEIARCVVGSLHATGTISSGILETRHPKPK